MVSKILVYLHSVVFGLLLMILGTKGDCQCIDKVIGGFGNCGRSYSNYGRRGPICYVPRINTCSSSFQGNNGFYSWDPCTGGSNVGSKIEYGGSNPDSYRVAIGRPFTVKGISRMATSQDCDINNTNDFSSWKFDQAPSILGNHTLNHEIGSRWLNHAEAEHASIASFARHTLQLMAIGAPSYLLMASQTASLDEVKHAKICYGFASSFLGVDFQPGPLNIDGSLEKLTPREIIRSVIQEGCIEETLSAIEAKFAGYKSSDPTIKNSLIAIASDETNHAQFAWNTIRWFLEKYPGEQTFVLNTFRVELDRQPLPSDNNVNSPVDINGPKSYEERNLLKYGIIGKGDRMIIRVIGLRAVIEPVFRSGFEDVSLISKAIMKFDFSTL